MTPKRKKRRSLAALKELGISLEQVAEVIAKRVKPEIKLRRGQVAKAARFLTNHGRMACYVTRKGSVIFVSPTQMQARWNFSVMGGPGPHAVKRMKAQAVRVTAGG